ncbi:MAG: adenylate/guanylate cyclase domain-containing protein [Candidatus Binatia bacterium]
MTQTPGGTTLSVAFVDLAGFTALTEAHGDEDAAGLAERFVDLARGELDHGDRLVKGIGDAVMLASSGPDQALELVGRILERLHVEPNFPVARAGIHHGPVVERAGDLFGSTVNLASRVAGQAFGGQVLATAPIADAARGLGLDVVDLGGFALRNLSDEIELYEVHVGPPVAGGAVDPVCRMRVEREAAAGRLRHEGRDFWFCSLECVAAFASAPERFTASPT